VSTLKQSTHTAPSAVYLQIRRLTLAVIAALVVVLGSAVPAEAQTGDYPYAHYYGPGSNSAGSYWTDANGNGISPYGYYYRNCTNYVAWKLQSLGVPDSKTRGLGNGGQWATNANGRGGVTVNTTPAYGAAAVNTSGTWGHVAFVEAVHGDGTITVSEYNWYSNGVYDGSYHNRTGTPAALGFSQFVHFGLQPGSTEPTLPPEVKGDLTYDGRADLIGISKASDGTPYVNVFEAGSNTFQTPSQWAHPTTGWANWDTKVWLSGSVGNDTATDLIGISRGGDGTPYIHVFPSRGSSFGDPILWAHPTTGWSDWDGKRWLMGDVTGDGKEDLIGISRASNGSAYVNVFRSTGSSFAAPVQWIHASSWTNWDMQQWLVEDFGGDGKEDLMLITPDVDGTPLIHVFPSRGNSFGSASLWAHPTNGWSEWETKVWLVGNMGTDEAADLIGISRGSDGAPYIHVFPSRGSQNQFGDPQLWAHPTTGWTDWEGKRWAVNDYGTDGKEDLIGISRAVDGPYIHVFPSRGDTFGSPALWSHPTTGWADWETKVWL
jgi:surface antigen